MNQTSVPSLTVRSRLEPMLPAARGLADCLCTHERAREVYPELLCLMHHIIRSSVPLLEMAEQQAAGLAASDPVAAQLVPYLQEHSAEERHHDEWLLDDYTALGRDPQEVLRRPPSPTVAALVGAIYYWVLHYHPVAILGYLVVMEGTPPTVAMIDELEARTGYPYHTFHTLTHHAVVDPHHGDELWALLDRLPLDADQTTVVTTAAMNSLDLLIAAQQELLDRWVPRGGRQHHPAVAGLPRSSGPE